MSTQFRFVVDPLEATDLRDARWDKELAELQSRGITIAGTGPDGDYPVLVEYLDGQTIDHTSEPIDGPFVEVYGTQPLEARR